jgi:GTP-binding protein EngB required for normal cell division
MSPITFQAQKQQTLALFQSAIALSKKYGTPNIEKSLNEAAEYLSNGKLCVAVCGEYKQGKSSLTNALLEEHNLFPVDVDVATSVVTTITYGSVEKITVIMGELGKTTSKQIQRSEIAEYVTEKRNRGNAQKVRLLVIESPNLKLKDGLVMADTPGVGSINIEHTAVSYAFIPNADVILFVSDAFAPLTTDDLQFIERIKDHCENFIFVVTKIDRKPDYPAIVESNRQKLAQVLDRPSEEILIIPVSSELKNVYLQHKEEEDLIESNFPTLEEKLWQFLNQQRGYILVMRALGKLNRHIAEIQEPMQVEWEAYQHRSQEELSKWEQEFQIARKDLQKLLDSNAEWKSQLSYGLNTIRAEITDEFQRGFTNIRCRVNVYLDDNRLLAEPKQVAHLLETDIDGLMVNIQDLMSNQASALQVEIEESTGLNITIAELAMTRSKTDLSEIEWSTKPSGLWKKSLAATQGATFKGTAGSTLGGLLGGIVGGVIGLALGGITAGPAAAIGAGIGSAILGVAGIKDGIQEGLSNIKQRDKREVSELINPQINNSHSLCQKALSKAFDELKLTMEQDLTSKIRQQKETLERTLQAVQNARQMSQTQMTQKAETLKVPLQQLSQLLSKIDHLAQAVNNQRDAEVPQQTPITKPQGDHQLQSQLTSQFPTAPLPSSQATAPASVTVNQNNSSYGDFADD